MLENDIKKFFDRKSAVFSKKDIGGFRGLLTDNSVHTVENQIPVVGRDSKYDLFYGSNCTVPLCH